MTIGSALAVLKSEFPAVTVSKLRYLEGEGLVTPSRTGSGYRKYSQADVERLRYTLTQQRDHYKPLAKIREELEDLDAGREVEEARAARVVATDGRLVTPVRGARITVSELCDLTGASVVEIEEMIAAGLFQTDSRGRVPARAVSAVNLVRILAARGISPRNLRSVRSNADYAGSMIEQVLAPVRSQRSGVAKERSAAEAMELAETLSKLYAEFLRIAVDPLG